MLKEELTQEEKMQYIRRICRKLNLVNWDKIVELFLQKEPRLNPFMVLRTVSSEFTKKELKDEFNISQRPTIEAMADALGKTCSFVKKIMSNGKTGFPLISESGCFKFKNITFLIYSSREAESIEIGYEEIMECLKD